MYEPHIHACSPHFSRGLADQQNSPPVKYLHAHGDATLPQLQRGIPLSERLLHMGIGWLAREGKLVFRHERGGLKVAVQTARHN
jgi:Winged helix-turn-helix domain (DUF2582)